MRETWGFPAPSLFPSMPKNLQRYYGLGHLHFIPFSCHRRLPLLRTARSRTALVRALNEVRTKFDFALVGYVVMPEHVHLLIGEPKQGNPSAVLHSLKLRVSKRMRHRRRSTAANQKTFPFHGLAEPRFWQPRFYDFNVYSAKKRREKLEYMHRNPVTRRLVQDPKDWVWSSYASYSGRGTPLTAIDFVK
jgi:REP-associated tyrosine transposase